ncbi:MAG: hypothetical protein O3A95_06830 [Planctomycetota bacterium]|nr:hypothetical protein [Planctomycetota bacterium]MDA1113997.1 hypothetical protein [Planctomycetota bacterium]
MKRKLPNTAQILAVGLILLGLAGASLGTTQPLGARSWQGLQGWWTLRRYHQAEADTDLPALLALGKEHLRLTGQGDALEFAVYKVAYGASGPSSNRLPSDALYWAQTGLQALDTSINQMPDPWSSLQIQAYTLVERVFPLTQSPEDLYAGLRAMEDRLAAGGGLAPSSSGLSALYKSFLALPPSERNPFILKRLERNIIPEDE